MSKFCGVISNYSKQQSIENKIEEPLTFALLEIIGTWLHNETEQLNEDFAIKAEFVNEHQQKLLKNEEALTNIHNQLSIVQNIIAEMEQSVQENDDCIAKLERCVNTLERSVLHTDMLGDAMYNEQQRNEHEYMFDQLKQLNVMIENLTLLLDDMEDYDYMQRQVHSPSKEIVALLDCQVYAMEKIDHNINNLVEKAENVDDLFTRALEKIALTRKLQRLPTSNRCNDNNSYLQ